MQICTLSLGISYLSTIIIENKLILFIFFCCRWQKQARKRRKDVLDAATTWACVCNGESKKVQTAPVCPLQGGYLS